MKTQSQTLLEVGLFALAWIVGISLVCGGMIDKSSVWAQMAPSPVTAPTK